MPKLSRKQSHSLSMDEAKALVEKIVEDVRESYPVLVDTVDWNSDKTAAKVKGKMFKGKFEVDTKQVRIDLDLSFLAKPFMGKVETKIDSKLKEYFG